MSKRTGAGSVDRQNRTLLQPEDSLIKLSISMFWPTTFLWYITVLKRIIKIIFQNAPHLMHVYNLYFKGSLLQQCCFNTILGPQRIHLNNQNNIIFSNLMAWFNNYLMMHPRTNQGFLNCLMGCLYRAQSSLGSSNHAGSQRAQEGCETPWGKVCQGYPI